MRTRKSYSPEFKAQLVLEMLKEEKTLAELSSDHSVHINQLRNWKSEFLEQMPQIFSKADKETNRKQTEYEQQIEDLYAEVGRLTTQLSWLKKKSGIKLDPK